MITTVFSVSSGPGVVILVVDPDIAENIAAALDDHDGPSLLTATEHGAIRIAAADAAAQGAPDFNQVAYVPFHPASPRPTQERLRLVEAHDVVTGCGGEAAPVTTPQPGDQCRLLGDYQVEHVAPCADGFPTGTITNCVTGTIVKRVQG